MKSTIRFADLKIKKEFNGLNISKTEDKRLYNSISIALDKIEENAFCAIQIPKKQIPKEYIKKYKIGNLWKYDLPKGWRLIYSVVSEGNLVISIIIAWINHKDYEKIFKY